MDRCAGELARAPLSKFFLPVSCSGCFQSQNAWVKNADVLYPQRHVACDGVSWKGWVSMLQWEEDKLIWHIININMAQYIVYCGILYILMYHIKIYIVP